MRKNQIYVSFALVFFLITTLSVWAQEDIESGIMPYYGLNLTHEQINKIQEKRLAFQKEILELRVQLQGRYLELRSLNLKGEAPEKMEDMIGQIEKMRLELEQRYFNHRNQIREILTEEQKVMFDRWGGLGLGIGRMGGMGLGMGYGPGMGRMGGMGLGMGYGPGFGRGFNRGWGRGWRRGPGIGMGMGMGFNSPRYNQRGLYRLNRFRNWW